jgi:hypothetical protein
MRNAGWEARTRLLWAKDKGGNPSGYWRCVGLGGPARSRRGHCWTSGRVCTLVSFRNDPPEESRSPSVARARGELGGGVCCRIRSREVRATGINHPPRFFRRAFSLRPETRIIRRALCGRRHSVAKPEDSDSNVLNYAHLPSPGEHAITPATGRSVPKLATAALSPPASAARKRVATAEASKDSTSPIDDESRTAIYDIAARTVYLPNGRRLEAHSGLGSHMDDARYVHLKRLGSTPPNTYKLVMREEPFHGVRAIRLVPVGDGKMFGRDGLLAHPYMLGLNGESNGCVSFSDYPAFLDAYLRGEVGRLIVVEHLPTAPSPRTASGWVPEFIKDLFRRS